MAGSGRNHLQHQGRGENGQDGNERIVRELCDPGTHEALGRFEKEERDKERTERDQDRKSNFRERQKKHGVDRGEPHDEVNGETRQREAPGALEEPALGEELRCDIAPVKEHLIDHTR